MCLSVLYFKNNDLIARYESLRPLPRGGWRNSKNTSKHVNFCLLLLTSANGVLYKPKNLWVDLRVDFYPRSFSSMAIAELSLKALKPTELHSQHISARCNSNKNEITAAEEVNEKQPRLD